MTTTKKINWNDTIKVKLTEYGQDIYYHHYDDAIAMGAKIKRHYCKTDDKGFSELQLWAFMEIFGPYIGMTCPNVVEDNHFYIEESILEEVPDDKK